MNGQKALHNLERAIFELKRASIFGGVDRWTVEKVTTAMNKYKEEIEKEDHLLSGISDHLVSCVQAVGEVECGRVKSKTDEEHAEDFLKTLKSNREHYDLGTFNQPLHGVYLKETEIVLCHTGTSPNAPDHARIIAGLWNFIHAGGKS